MGRDDALGVTGGVLNGYWCSQTRHFPLLRAAGEGLEVTKWLSTTGRGEAGPGTAPGEALGTVPEGSRSMRQSAL